MSDGFAHALLGTPNPSGFGVVAPYSVRRVAYRSGERTLGATVASDLTLEQAFAQLPPGRIELLMASPAYPAVIEVWE